MLSATELRQLRTIESHIKDKASLVDIKTININGSLNKTERILKYVDDIRNPYLFRVGDTIVRVQYGKGNLSLQESVANFLTRQ